MLKKVVYLDFDNTLVDTVYAGCCYMYYEHDIPLVNGMDIEKYSFAPLFDVPSILDMFENEHLFHNLYVYPDMWRLLIFLKENGFKIIIPTYCLSEKSKQWKKDWFENNPLVTEYIDEVIYLDKEDKSKIDMEGCIIIDDLPKYHDMSNASLKLSYKHYPKAGWYPTQVDVTVSDNVNILINKIKSVYNIK